MKKITSILIILTLIIPCGAFAAGESASFSLGTLSLYTGEACGISVTTSAETLVWNISNTEVVSLFGDYFKSKTVYAKKTGTAEITVSDALGNVFDTMTVTVSEKAPIITTNAYFSKGEDTLINKNTFGEHLSTYVNYDNSYKLLEENIAFGSARVAFKPGNDVTDYKEYAKSFLTPVMRNNMTIVIILSRFAIDDSEKLMEQVEAICSVLKDYQECIYIEFGNEVYSLISDTFTISDYTEKCKSMYSQINEYSKSIEKKIYTAVPVLDMVGKNGVWNDTFISDQSYFDAVVPHLYTNIYTYDGYTQNVKMKRLFSSNENIYECLRYLKDNFPDKEIWITEYGVLDNAMLSGVNSAERARLQSSKTLGVALCNIDKTLKFLSDPDVEFANYHSPVDSQLFGLVQNTDILPGFYTFEKISDILSECTQISELTSDNVPKFSFVGKNYTDNSDVNSVSGYSFSDIYGLKYVVFINRAESPCCVSFEDKLFKNIWEYSTDYVLGEDYLRKTGTFVDLPLDITTPCLPEDLPLSEKVTLKGYSMTVCAVYRELPDSITVKCNFDGKKGVPLDADIDLEFSSDVYLTTAEISIIGNNKRVQPTLKGSGTKYALSFEKEEDTLYEISIDNIAVFNIKTAYNTDNATVNTQNKVCNFEERKKDLTLDIVFKEPLIHPGTSRILTLEDTTSDSELSLNFYFNMQNGYYDLSWYTKDASATGGGMGPSGWLSKMTYENIIITINDYSCSAYARLSEGTYTYLGELDLKSFRNNHISDIAFKVNRAEVKQTSLMSVDIGTDDTKNIISVISSDKYGNVCVDTSNADLGGIIICAAYDNTSSELFKLQFKKLNEDDTKVNFELGLNNIENLIYKVFVWNNFNKMIPLTNSCIYKLN